MGKFVHDTEVSNLLKPALSRMFGLNQDTHGKFMEDVLIEKTDHDKKGKLAKVEKRLAR